MNKNIGGQICENDVVTSFSRGQKVGVYDFNVLFATVESCVRNRSLDSLRIEIDEQNVLCSEQTRSNPENSAPATYVGYGFTADFYGLHKFKNHRSRFVFARSESKSRVYTENDTVFFVFIVDPFGTNDDISEDYGFEVPFQTSRQVSDSFSERVISEEPISIPSDLISLILS